MRIGCPKERKTDEFRVALTPTAVAALVGAGHEVLVEAEAGLGAGFSDEAYTLAGAFMVPGPAEVFRTDLVVKVKEPVEEEFDFLRAETVVFSFLHLAAAPALAEEFLRRRVTSIAFETIFDEQGAFPLLAPMSMVAGRLAVQVGAQALQRDRGGRGVLLSGLPGVPPAHVVVLGGGMVGRNAAYIAAGMGARVSVLDLNPRVLRDMERSFGARVETVTAARTNLERIVPTADLLVGAVLVPGAKAPRVVSRSLIGQMQVASVAVDVAVDQGGCFETTRPTTHSRPTYVEEGVIHYAVTNIPSLTARTSTLALVDSLLPFLLRVTHDLEGTLEDHEGIRGGLTTRDGEIVHPAVREALGR